MDCAALSEPKSWRFDCPVVVPEFLFQSTQYLYSLVLYRIPVGVSVALCIYACV